ncbi:MAG: AAA family ATPase [Candidatus Woesearchaeota archaeon]
MDKRLKQIYKPFRGIRELLDAYYSCSKPVAEMTDMEFEQMDSKLMKDISRRRKESQRCMGKFHARLKITREEGKLHIAKFMRKHNLGCEETCLVLSMLFQGVERLDMDSILRNALYARNVDKAMAVRHLLPGSKLVDKKIIGINESAGDFCYSLSKDILNEIFGRKNPKVEKEAESGFIITKPKRNFSDIVLPEKTLGKLKLALKQVKHGSSHFRKWGLDRLQESSSLSMIFVGAPGVGKSITSQAIANALAKRMYNVNYAELENCYVGETGKNIAKVFKEASENDAVLFFDEADSICSARTSGGGAIDSYHNEERNIMLKELENFKGIVIFSTNIAAGMDKAFERRISMHIHFQKPGFDERLQLWKLMLGKCPQAADVDLARLSRSFEFTGGDIRNAVLHAGRMSIGGKELGMAELEAGCREVVGGRAIMCENSLRERVVVGYLG